MTLILIMVFTTLFRSDSCDNRIILKETFDYPDGDLPSHFWFEGTRAEIRDNRLYINADTGSFRASTVWLDKNLSGNISVEFDVHVVASADTANNINCFLFCSEPGGKHLKETSAERKDGAYKHYHPLNGYIFTFLANGYPENGRLRFRDNPGFNLIAEDYGFECRSGTTYKVRINRQGNRFQYLVNGILLLEAVDDQFNRLHKDGLFGFRTWHTTLWWDNLVITQQD